MTTGYNGIGPSESELEQLAEAQKDKDIVDAFFVGVNETGYNVSPESTPDKEEAYFFGTEIGFQVDLFFNSDMSADYKTGQVYAMSNTFPVEQADTLSEQTLLGFVEECLVQWPSQKNMPEKLKEAEAIAKDALLDFTYVDRAKNLIRVLGPAFEEIAKKQDNRLYR